MKKGTVGGSFLISDQTFESMKNIEKSNKNNKSKLVQNKICSINRIKRSRIVKKSEIFK